MALVVIRLVWPAVTDDTHDSEMTDNHIMLIKIKSARNNRTKASRADPYKAELSISITAE
jgi:hypothetical protein